MFTAKNSRKNAMNSCEMKNLFMSASTRKIKSLRDFTQQRNLYYLAKFYECWVAILNFESLLVFVFQFCYLYNKEIVWSSFGHRSHMT